MATATPSTGAQATLRTLTDVLRAMFPHPSFPDGPYERCAEAMVASTAEDPPAQGRLQQGLTDLEARGFADADENGRLQVLRDMAGSPFFEAVRAKAILTLYNDTEVWRLLGYEGASYAQGGYLERGFGDLDWLPEPSLGEVKP